MKSHFSRYILVLSAVLAFANCDQVPTDPNDDPPRLEYVAGRGQTASEGMPLADSLAVRVMTAGGQPVAGVPVVFTVTGGGGSVSPASTITDAQGFARTQWTLGTAVAQSVEARLPGMSVEPVSFSAEVISDLPGTTPAAAIRASAAFIYDSVQAGRDVAPYLPLIFERLGIQVLAATSDGERLQSALNDGQPVVLDVQLRALARAFRNEMLIPRASFLEGFKDKGATLQGGGALTEASLSIAMEPLATRQLYSADEILAAFVLALGVERASRSGDAIIDPVWGDEWLDPLQFTLLDYALHYSRGSDSSCDTCHRRPVASPDLRRLQVEQASAAMRPMPHAMNPNPSPNPIKPGLEWGRGKVTGWIGGKLEMPLDQQAAAKASLCVSVVLYGFKAEVKASPAELNRKPASPNVSGVSVQLTFEDDYPFIIKSIMKDFGCPLPEKGSAAGAGKPLRWTVTGELPMHGALDLIPSQTDAAGRALTTFRTIEETVPEPLRFFRKVATGTIDVRASGLVSGWKGLEASIGLGIYNPVDEGARLFVGYYDLPPALDLSYRVTYSGPMYGVGSGEITTRGTIRLERNRAVNTPRYEGRAAITYENFSYHGVSDEGCTLRSNGTVAGRLAAVVATDHPLAQGLLAASWSIPPQDAPQEILNISGGGDCPNSQDVRVGIFAQMLSTTYATRPVTNWEQDANGLVKRYNRTVFETVRGPVVEVAEFTLRPVLQ